MSSKLSTFIFKDLEQDNYLKDLYQSLLEHYSAKLFHIPYKKQKYSIDDLLRFADLLSHSVDNNKSDFHKNIAQSIISLLMYIYPDNDKVLLYRTRILTTVKNYPALNNIQKFDIETKYSGDYLMYFLFEEVQKEYFKVPGSKGLEFIGPQKEIFESLDKYSLSFSTPTSMGKSFLMRMFMKNKISKGENKDFAFIVPTKALINETYIKVINDLKGILAERNYSVIRSVNEILDNDNRSHIFIMTPERMLYLLTSDINYDLGYVFIDESQKISVNNSRSTFYYQFIDLLQKGENSPLISFASPNIPNPQVYLKLISGKDHKISQNIRFSPVNQIYFILDYINMKILCFNMLSNEFFEVIPIKTDDFLNAVTFMKDSQSLIYCSRTKDAIEYALKLSEKNRKELNDPVLNKLANKISNQIHSEYYLADLVRKGIAYHVGYLPGNIKNKIEKAYRDKRLKILFCTNTLMEGVNLPANNLFVTSTKKGNKNFDEIDFYNLSGRIGRLGYSMLGNVFLIAKNDSPKDKDKNEDKKKFENFLTKDIPKQSLSVDKIVKKSKARCIVKSLLQGDLALNELLDKYPKNYSDFNILRKYTLIFLRCLQNNTTGVVRKTFEKFVSSDEENRILKVISEKYPKQKIDEDINISLDQNVSVRKLVESGESFPKIYENGPEYNETLVFLKKLAQAFNWSKYEHKDLGKMKDGEYTQLKWYTVILIQWISGYGLNNIIRKSIEYKENNPNKLWINNEFVKYTGSKEQKNVIINDTLKTLQEQILFKISNYLFKYAKEYKQYNKLTSLKNNWYEFVEYGTSNELKIWLQKNGYSRDVANFIFQNSNYYRMKEDGNYLLSLDLKNIDGDVGMQTEHIAYNNPKIFTEKFD